MTTPNGNTQRYRISELERKVEALSGIPLEAAILKRRVDELVEDVKEIKDDLKSIRRGLWVAAATFASLAVGIFTLIFQGATQ